jgi:hypothetical protein
MEKRFFTTKCCLERTAINIDGSVCRRDQIPKIQDVSKMHRHISGLNSPHTKTKKFHVNIFQHITFGAEQ